MNIIPKKKAIIILEKIIEEGKSVQYRLDTKTWARKALVRIEGIYGKGSRQVNEITPLVDSVFRTSLPDNRINYADSILAIIISFYTEIQEFWFDEGPEETVKPISEGAKRGKIDVSSDSREVFIVHGHDSGRMQALARFIEHFDLNPIILHERPSKGSTIIEKLERHANVAFAVILLTPDDVGSVVSNPKNLQFRARQNVVLELGFFMGRLGRMRTCALVVEGVEIPTDYSGVVYIPIDEGDAWKFKLAKEFQAAGLTIDMNKIK